MVAQRGSDNHIFIRLASELRPRGINNSEGQYAAAGLRGLI